MDRKELEERTKRFALRIITLVNALPKGHVRNVIGFQLLKSGTSIGANYREASRAGSKAEFIHKIGIVEKEASETYFWLELLLESGSVEKEKLSDLMDECDQLIAIFVSMGRSAKRRK